MLEVEDIHVAYGKVRVLFGITFSVQPGEVLCLMGHNGAGKTTLLKSIMGLLPLSRGEVRLDGETISALQPHEIPRRGIGYVPQGRRLFPELTVAENLAMGMLFDPDSGTLEAMLELFPVLRSRLEQRAGTLSGGEQQMLAIARALCLRPRVVLMDEPTEGLQPSMRAAIRDVIVEMKQQGLAVLLVEQQVRMALDVADRVALIENGRNPVTLTPKAILADQSILTHHLGI